MNVSLAWLKAVAPGLDLSAEEVSRRLALRGAPVEESVQLGAELGDVVIARVLEARRHPNADRLSLCRVEGPEGDVQVVCGAPNVEAGAFYPFAPVGAVLPGDFKIARRKIRGEHSEGMLCSESELGLGTDSGGIMKLEGDYVVGGSFVEALGLNDVRLDVEVTANRGDLLSHVGVARELHDDGTSGIQIPDIPEAKALSPSFARGDRSASSAGVTITIDAPDLCSRYLGAVIRNVTVGPSPEWLASRLRAAGSRPINNVVDATNYVLLELGQPLHAFDLRHLAGSEVVVRRARAGEKIQTLDGEERSITEEMLMICDSERPVAIAGVMGGDNSEVSSETTDVLLECALFEPKQVRATRRALNMSTDASYRFERGVDPDAMETALLRAVQIILATAGGGLEGDVIDAFPKPHVAPVVSLRPSRVGHVLGIPFTKPQITELLSPLGFTVEEAGEDNLRITVPGFRSYDTLREVDLIEEVARTFGFDAFPQELGPFRPGTVPDDVLFHVEDSVRRLLVAEGLSEAQTPSLGPPGQGDVALLNPMSSQESHLRRDRLGGLLSHVERNMSQGVRDVRLFELGTGFAAGDDRPVETTRVAAVLAGRRAPVHWSGPGGAFDVFDVAHLLGVLGDVVSPGARVAASEAAGGYYEVGFCYDLLGADGAVLGQAGKISPSHMDLPPWADVVVGLEVVLPDPPVPVKATTARRLPSQPSSSRDIAFLLPRDVSAGAVAKAIAGAGMRLLEAVQIFDLYEGDDLPPGTRSVAYGLRFRAEDRTLTDDEVDKAVRRILERVKSDTGVEPRG